MSPLELFFDLVFVLAITQCTALMAGDPTWRGVARGLVVLGLLWWSWVGYAWLTSVVDPEEAACASSSSPPWRPCSSPPKRRALGTLGVPRLAAAGVLVALAPVSTAWTPGPRSGSWRR